MNQLTLPQLFAVWVLPVLFAITVHEVAHGWVASKFGDKTAKMMGRVTLNPLKHIDPIGTVAVPIILFVISSLSASPFIFGWAKPVPVNWTALRKPRRDMAFVAVAGPIANLIMALIWAGIGKGGEYLFALGYHWALAIAYMGQAGIMINCVVLLLNLIPIPPLDGSRVVSAFLPNKWLVAYNRIERFGLVILLGLLVFGLLPLIIGRPLIFLSSLINSIFGM